MAVAGLGESHPTRPEIPASGKGFGCIFWVYASQLES